MWRLAVGEGKKHILAWRNASCIDRTVAKKARARKETHREKVGRCYGGENEEKCSPLPQAALSCLARFSRRIGRLLSSAISSLKDAGLNVGLVSFPDHVFMYLLHVCCVSECIVRQRCAVVPLAFLAPELC
jgi:hypothetical protein